MTPNLDLSKSFPRRDDFEETVSLSSSTRTGFLFQDRFERQI